MVYGIFNMFFSKELIKNYRLKNNKLIKEGNA
jgi:hypothetical protein